MSSFGRGIGLTEEFDLRLSTGGDVKIVEESDELSKDLALFAAVTLDDHRGGPNTPEYHRELRVRARDALLADDRVQNVESIDVDGDGDTAVIDATIVTEDETVDLVFEV